MSNKPLISFVLLLSVLVLPAAHASPRWLGDCYYNPGFVLDQDVCPEGGSSGQTCDSVQVFILSDGQCHARDGAGCDGIQVFVLSDRNCHGSSGKDGCVGTRIFLIGSEQNCKGGDGNATMAINRLVR